MTKVRLAIFDCDGTLVDSQANIVVAMEHAFNSANERPPLPEQTRRTVGLSPFEAMRVLHPAGTDDDHALLVEKYKQAFLALRGNGAVQEPLYDGIAELLDRLRDDGWLLGVATGKSDRGLQRCLTHHGLEKHFITLQTADRHPSKPHPSMIEQALSDAGAAPEQTVMIGDTVYDVSMGNAAGCVSIGVAWGYHPPEELLGAGAKGVAHTTEELGEMLGAMK